MKRPVQACSLWKISKQNGLKMKLWGFVSEQQFENYSQNQSGELDWMGARWTWPFTSTSELNQSLSMILYSHLPQINSFRCFIHGNPFLFPCKTCSKCMQTIKNWSTFPFSLVVRKGHRELSHVSSPYSLWCPKLTPKTQFSTPSLHSAYLLIPSPVQETSRWGGEREECRRARSEVRFIMDSYLMGSETKMLQLPSTQLLPGCSCTVLI